MKAGSTAMIQRPRDRVPSGSMLALPGPRRPDRANPLTNFWWSLFWQHWRDLHELGSPWTDSQQGILCWGVKGIQEEIPSEEASTLQIGSVAFLPVHNSILVTDYLTKMGIKTVPHRPYSPDLALVTFAYSLSSEAVVMRQLRRWKRMWQRSLIRSHKRTSMGPSRSCWNGTTSALQPEEITSKGTWVSCVYYQ